MSDLDESQAAAVKALSKGNMAVIAGPGSGKTHTLTSAVESILKLNPKANVVCLTFTNKAAENLRDRLPKSPKMFVGTFHSLAVRLLDVKPKILTDDEAYIILGEVKRQLHLRNVSSRELALQVSRLKNGSKTTIAKQVLDLYNQILAERELLDYDDLILRALDTAKPSHYDFIFVDEFQDTSPRQYELLQKMAGKSTKLFVIGDPNQSIYKFRGTDGTVFLRFGKDFNPSVVRLEQNYRSTPEIVSVTNLIFKSQPQQAVRHVRGQVRIVETLDEYSEAEFVARTVEQALGGTDWQRTHHDQAKLDAESFTDFVVLYRTQRQGKLLAEKLRAAGLPIQRLGEESPYASSSVKKAMELADNKQALKLKPSDLAHQCAEALGKADDPSLLQLENLASRFSSFSDFQNYLEQLASQNYFDLAASAVVLSTIHASKGLEFKNVFVAGCNDGVLPSTKAEEVEEERRLFYVALTRARDSLTLVYTKWREKKPSQISPFLKDLNVRSEIDDNLVALEKRRARSHRKRAQQHLF